MADLLPPCITYGLMDLTSCEDYCAAVHPGQPAVMDQPGCFCNNGDVQVCDATSFPMMPCHEADVFDQQSCADVCDSETATYSPDTGCACLEGNLICTATNPTGIACSDVSITSASECNTACNTGNFRGVRYTKETNGVLAYCACQGRSSVVSLCGAGSVPPPSFAYDDDEYAEGDPDGNDDFQLPDFSDRQVLDAARAGLANFLGSQCRPAVDRAVTTQLLECLAQEMMGDSSSLSRLLFSSGTEMTPAQLTSLCGGPCTRTVFSALSTLDDNNCLDLSYEGSGASTSGDIVDEFFENDGLFPENFDENFAENYQDLMEQYEDGGSSFSGDSENYDYGMAGFDYSSAVNFVDLAPFAPRVNFFCTVSSANDRPCGEMAPVVEAALLAGAPTEQQCRDIADFGRCLGSMVRAAETDDDVIVTPTVQLNSTVAEQLAVQCEGLGVTGLAEAAQATEAPVDLASSGAAAAMTTSAVFGAVMAATVALLSLAL